MRHHPVHQTHDGFFDTSSGIKVSIHNPTVDMINTYDIIHALANICRFGGHAKEFFSILQHSLLVSYLAPKELKFPALMHDAAEAYIHDIIKPLKIILGESYKTIEDRFEDVIFGKYDISQSELAAIKPYDKQALEIEHERLILGNKRGSLGSYGLMLSDQEVVKSMFINAYYQYCDTPRAAIIHQDFLTINRNA